MIPAYISKTDAISIIAERTKPRYEKMRDWKNKINGKLTSRIKKGLIGINENGELRSGHIAETMKEAHPDCFYDWPCSVRVTPKSCELSFTGNQPLFLPSDLTQCHDIIKAMHAEIQQLKPEAEKYRDICIKNKNNALRKKS